MRMRMLVAGLLLGIAVASTAADDGFVLRGAWIRAAPPTAPVMAGYMTIENRTHERKILVRAASALFADVTIHRTEEVRGVTRMIPLSAVEIAPHGGIVFQPGGYHLMLAQARRVLRTGDKVPIELTFADGARATATFVVREPPGGTTDDHAHAKHTSTPSGSGEAHGHRH